MRVDEREQLARGRRGVSLEGGELVGLPRAPAPAREQLEHLELHGLDALDVDRRELGEHVIGQAEPLELHDRTQHVEVGGVVRVAAELGRVAQEPGVVHA